MASITAAGVAGLGVGCLTRSATTTLAASSTAAFRKVPPMSTPNVKGAPGRAASRALVVGSVGDAAGMDSRETLQHGFPFREPTNFYPAWGNVVVLDAIAGSAE